VPARQAAGDVTTGFAVGVSSPFNLVLMLALLPQFLDVAALTPARLALAAPVVLAASALPMLAVCRVASGLGRFGPAMRCWVARIGGAAVLGFAVLAAITPI
jgi:threonine/homoserine/homoserine lactone efflux protein